MDVVFEREVVGLRRSFGNDKVPATIAEGDEKGDTYTGYMHTLDAMRNQHAKEKEQWAGKISVLEEQLANSESNAQTVMKAAQMALESAELAKCSAQGAESSRKAAEAKLVSVKAELEEQKLRVGASAERLTQLASDKEQACREAQAAKARAEMAEAAKELAETEAAKLKSTGSKEALQERSLQVADLQDQICKLREKDERKKAVAAEKEQLQKEMKDQQKYFQKRFDEDDAEKKRLLQQATNAKTEVERLKKEARYSQHLEAAGVAAAAHEPPQFAAKAKGKKAQADVRASSKERERGNASRGRASSKDRAPAFERAASYEPMGSCQEYDEADRPLSARGTGGFLGSLFGRR